MAEPPDLQDLAKRYLDLWQDQLRAMAADPDTMASVARMLSAAAGQSGPEGAPAAVASPLAWWQAAAAAMQTLSPMGGATPLDPAFATGRAAAEARSPAASAASDGSGGGLRDLERRLAALEARLDALEPGVRTGGGSAKGKPRKGKR